MSGRGSFVPLLGSGLIVLGLCGVVVTCPVELLSAVRRRGNPGDVPGAPWLIYDALVYGKGGRRA